MNKENKGICLIGGSGFIGSRLADRLERSGQLFGILDIRQSLTGRPTTVADVTDIDGLSAHLAGYRALVNLAAEHRDDVEPVSRYDRVNVDGARNVCQAAREQGVEIILFTSTVAVYGFAPPDTDESGDINPFNHYGRTKAEAEGIYREWQQEDPLRRTLVIVRPTVVFGEGNRGNVYNLLQQIHSGRFVMVGSGENRKSMAYVENIAAFLELALGFSSGIHVYNYVDKPDYTMNGLVAEVLKLLGRSGRIRLRIPYSLGCATGRLFDAAASLTGRSFPVSSIRVKKFCSDTAFATSVGETGFLRPCSLQEGLERTVRYEFLEKREGPVFYTE
ncbi:MAG: NAD-dependent epimerase/dehydratase family protein [Desulfohalobiaceae bacterium]|nr:NAD-dependent epimerase/dehydratase family protein [Desulfohalobiaceae bacterium]